MNSISMLERVIARTENPLPIPQYENNSLILEPGSSISTGIVATNPLFALQTGPVEQIVVQCGVPPTNQTLVLDILAGGVSLLGTANLIKIASGDGTQHIYETFVKGLAATYVVANQSITVAAYYIITGPNPARAGSVSVVIRRRV